MTNKKWMLVIILALALLYPVRASAQTGEGELRLGLTKNFGYGGLGSIQGSFTVKVIDPPPGLERVEFYLDGELLASLGEGPFAYKFNTSQFGEGEHSLSARGYLEDGSWLESNRISKRFLSAGQAWGETQQLIGPILIGTAVLTVLGIGVPLLFQRDKNFVLGKYSLAGGAVCPRCALPFSRSALAPNLVVGKLVRCPHCGKIGILARAMPAQLQAAEARFAARDQGGAAAGDRDQDLSKMLDDSRFEE